MDYSSAPAHNGQRPTIPSQSSNGRSYQTAQTGSRHDAGLAQQQQPATAVQQNAILPPIDPRAFGFSEAQLLAMLSHIQAQAQSGIVPPPPFAPSFLGTNTLPILPPPPPPILPSVAPPHNVQAISSSSPRHAQTQPQPQSSQVLARRAALPANNRVAEIMEADKEEGEVSDGELSRLPASQQGRTSNVAGSRLPDHPGHQSMASQGRVHRRDSARREFSSTGRGSIYQILQSLGYIRLTFC